MKKMTRPHPKNEAEIYRNYEDLPRFMTITNVADCLRISVSSAYTLSKEPDFPVIIFNCERRVRRDKFMEWLNSKEHREWHID